MLNRNAEALFWVGRYMERAENHARLIDVHYHLGLEGGEEDDFQAAAEGKWIRIVDALGSRVSYEAKYGVCNERDVLFYVTLDRDNENSLVSCVNHARNNLRTMREKVPSEMWDAVNSFHLWLREKQREDFTLESPHLFYNRIKEWTALFTGISQSVMARENEWRFIECGRYLERAENTLRILKSVCGDAGVLPDDTADGYPYLQAVLRSVSGYQVFRRYHADSMAVEPIIEFLVLHPAFPRSVFYSLYEMDVHLRGIEFQDVKMKAAHHKMIRQDGKVIAELSCMEREDLSGERGKQTIEQLMNVCGQLGAGFASTFFRLGEVSA